MPSPEESKELGPPRTGSSVGDIIEAARRHKLLALLISVALAVGGGAFQFFLSLEEKTKLEAINGVWAKAVAFLSATIEVNRQLWFVLIGWFAWWLTLLIARWVQRKWFPIRLREAPIVGEGADQQPATGDWRLRYELFETPARAVVYKLRTELIKTEMVHWLCPNCFDGKNVKSILQPQPGEWSRRFCPICNWSFSFLAGGASPLDAIRKPKDQDNGAKLASENAKLKQENTTLQTAVGNWKGRSDLAHKQIVGLTVRHEQEKQAVQQQLTALTAKLDAALPKKLDKLETDLLREIALTDGGCATEVLAKKHELPLARIEHHLDKLAGQKLITVESKMHEEGRLGFYMAASLTPTGRTVAVNMKLI